MIAYLLEWIFGTGKAAAMIQAAEKLRIAIESGNRMALEEANEEIRQLLLRY